MGVETVTDQGQSDGFRGSWQEVAVAVGIERDCTLITAYVFRQNEKSLEVSRRAWQAGLMDIRMVGQTARTAWISFKTPHKWMTTLECSGPDD